MSEGFPERLRVLRKQRDLSQGGLAKLVGVHYNHIGRYERGESRPTAETLVRLAAALDVSTDYLMGGSSEEAAKARFEDRELLRQFREVEKMPDADKSVVKRLLDAFLFKYRVEHMARAS